MNDLVLREFAQRFPTCATGLQRAFDIFDSIESFDDIERVFLKGAGLSPNTYRSYLTAVRQFYDYTEGLNPLQVTPADIESFYDNMIHRGTDRNTAALRIAGLKRFFKGIRGVVPFYRSPFEIMSEKLVHKISKKKRGNRTKKSLTKAEIRRILTWLHEDCSEKTRCDRAAFYMLVTSGLRASELLQLTWGDIELFEGTWTAKFIGKGDLEAEQELYAPAIEVARQYFRSVFGHDPGPADAVFWTVPAYSGDERRPMSYFTLWDRIKKVGVRAREAGIITRELQFTPHLLRRSYATNLYRAGMKIKAIQEKTRHASIDVLVKHYVDDDEKASPYIEQFIGQIM